MEKEGLIALFFLRLRPGILPGFLCWPVELGIERPNCAVGKWAGFRPSRIW